VDERQYKRKAKKKLFATTKKIGYQINGRTTAPLLFQETRILKTWYQLQEMHTSVNAKLGKPVDKSEWFTTPSTVTAYNNPSANEIVFPAGILQSPYFDNEADDALNYGGIGMVIGHEITHTLTTKAHNMTKRVT
jgi:putative endopeptidase